MDDVLKHARTILQTTPLRWEALATNVSADVLGLAPAAGEWSALDCLQHIVDTERTVFPVRIKALLAGQDFQKFDPDSRGARPSAKASATELAAEFGMLRAANLELFDKLTAADLTRKARHQELGIVSLSELLHHWAGHDLMHTVQAERALLQPFIQGCGPWQSYFTDHVAGNPAKA